MKFALRIAILALFITAVIHAQVSNPSILSVSTAPSGPCAGGLPNQQVISSGVQYTCQGGTWGIIGTGGYTITSPGTAYAVGNGQATATGGAQPGIGTGLLIDVNSITQGNGSVVLTIPFTVVPVS